ncbi:sulfatase-like hydrolase/transferase [Planctomicrobium piriforme]|uniref:Arylsulfatase A n=1 Tax=Planctomicrobium piriforme TaxID=1576369 RepID=A0A1I3BBN2_9PLAN|nr:sulfatase-like hydrolase/transferase [Planctomicrobium piriforme]SFH59725.1 Arylsulfatase A [Planctomicrobium piriforme]
MVLRCALVIYALCLLYSTAESAAPRPNIVFLVADDLGREDCGFMGGKEIRTPHIDKLAKAGAILDAFYVMEVCSPTRVALMTGRYPMRVGMNKGTVRPWADYGLPLEERTLPAALKTAGYATGIFGKWHLGHCAPEYLPLQRGFDHHYGHYNGALDYFTKIRDGGYDWHRDGKVNRDEGYSTTLIGREAAKFVRENAGQRPFFLYVPFNGVHTPHQAPDEYVAAYPGLKGKRQIYAGMLSALDDAVGEIVAAVDHTGIRQQTLFVFSSDNGGPSPGKVTDNGKYREGKATMYEGGVRVAAFATWDGHIPAGITVTEPLHMVDWYPTLLTLAGVSLEQPLPLDGLNLWETLTSGKPSPHDVILINTLPRSGAVRMGDWKLVVSGSDPESDDEDKSDRSSKKKGDAQPFELFNLKDDPYEKKNLAASEPAKLEELRKKLAEFAAQAVPPKGGPQPKGFVAPEIWGDFEK